MYLCQAMKTSFFNHPRVRQILTVLFLSGALACIFPPATPEFRWWAQHCVPVAIGYIGVGLFFLVFKNSRLMFVCLGCGAAISFHYHERAEQEWRRKLSTHPDTSLQIPNDVPNQKSASFPLSLPHYESSPPSQ